MAIRVIDADNIGMLQASCRTGLGPETRLVFDGGFFGEIFHLDGLDRHAAVKIRIACLIDQAHRALAQHADEVISTKLVQTHGMNGSHQRDTIGNDYSSLQSLRKAGYGNVNC